MTKKSHMRLRIDPSPTASIDGVALHIVTGDGQEIDILRTLPVESIGFDLSVEREPTLRIAFSEAAVEMATETASESSIAALERFCVEARRAMAARTGRKS